MLLSIILLPLSEVFQSAWYLQAKKKYIKQYGSILSQNFSFWNNNCLFINKENYYNYIVYFSFLISYQTYIVFGINYSYLLKTQK